MNWRDAKEVEAFVAKHKLPPVGWVELGTRVWLGINPTAALMTKVDDALRKEFADNSGTKVNRLGKLTERFLALQDEVIFNKMLPEEIPAFLAQAEKSFIEIAGK